MFNFENQLLHRCKNYVYWGSFPWHVDVNLKKIGSKYANIKTTELWKEVLFFIISTFECNSSESHSHKSNNFYGLVSIRSVKNNLFSAVLNMPQVHALLNHDGCWCELHPLHRLCVWAGPAQPGRSQSNNLCWTEQHAGAWRRCVCQNLQWEAEMH